MRLHCCRLVGLHCRLRDGTSAPAIRCDRRAGRAAGDFSVGAAHNQGVCGETIKSLSLKKGRRGREISIVILFM